MAEYSEISLDEAIALADVGAVVYAESHLDPGVYIEPYLFRLYKRGKLDQKYMRSYERTVYVRVETYEP